MLFACGSLATFLFEIPTGLLGDKLGERFSLVLGSALTALATFLFIVGSVPLLFLGEFIFGLGATFFSGPFDALLYQFCKQTNTCEEEYSKVVSRSYSFQWLALCVSFLGCSVFSMYGSLSIPFYATLVVNLLTIAAFFLPDVPKVRNASISSNFVNALRAVTGNSELRRSCLLNAVLSMLLVCGYQLLQPYLAKSGIQASYNGIVYCFAALCASGGSFFFEKLQKILQSKNTMALLALVLISGCFFGLSHASGVTLIFLLICCYRLIWGVTSPMFSFLVNKNIPKDEYRDTVFR